MKKYLLVIILFLCFSKLWAQGFSSDEERLLENTFVMYTHYMLGQLSRGLGPEWVVTGTPGVFISRESNETIIMICTFERGMIRNVLFNMDTTGFTDVQTLQILPIVGAALVQYLGISPNIPPSGANPDGSRTLMFFEYGMIGVSINYFHDPENAMRISQVQIYSYLR